MEDIEKVYKKNDDDIDKIELKLNNFLHIGEKSEFKTYLDIKKYLDLYF